MSVNLRNAIYDYIDRYEFLVPELESLDSGSVYPLTGMFLCSHQGPNGRTLGCQMFVSSTIKHISF